MGHAEYSVAMGLQLPGRDVHKESSFQMEVMVLNGLLVQEVDITYQRVLEGGMGSLNLQTGRT
jgi:hypothetical protein